MSVVNKGQRVIFISEVRNPNGGAASSTQIMTSNIIEGLRQLTDCFIFVAIKSKSCPSADIENYYKKYVDALIVVDGVMDNELACGKYKALKLMYQSVYGRSWVYRSMVQNIVGQIRNDDIVITHSPSVEAAALGALIKENVPTIRYIQYWGDPIALSLITPKQMNIKRYPAFVIEKKLHQYADKIVYGTKTLMDAHKCIHAESVEKMDFCDVPYSYENSYLPNDELLCGYIGNYYSNIRDILPLYKAFEKMGNDKLIICGSGDVDLFPKENINIIRRVPQSQIGEIEKHIDIEICLLNSVGVQIPGKIFYHTNTSKHILIILDGPMKSQIREYLDSFNRFEFCENTVESIQSTVKRIKDKGYERKKISTDVLSPIDVATQIIK